MAKRSSRQENSACWLTSALCVLAVPLAWAQPVGAAPSAAAPASAPGATLLPSAEYLDRYHGAAPPPAGEPGSTVRLPARSASGNIPVPASGSLWFRLHTRLDPQRDTNFQIYIPRIYPNAAVYLNGFRLGASKGGTRPGIAAWNYPLLFNLPSGLMRDGDNVILVQIVNHGWALQASLSQVWVGPEATLTPRYEARLWAQVNGVEVVSLLVGAIGLFALVLWLKRRSEVVFGLFALACGIWIFRNSPFFVIYAMGPYYDFIAFTDAALFWLVAVLFRFCCRLLDRPLPLLERTLFVLAFVVTLALWLGGEAHEGTISSLTYALLIPPSAAFLVYLSLLAVRGRTIELFLLWLAAVVTCVSGAYDLMVLLTWVPWPGIYMMPYSALFFALALGWVLTERFVLAHTRYERLNRDLDARIRAREQELAVHYQRATELERERAVAGERERMLRDMHDGMGLQLISSMRMVESRDLTREQLAAMLGEALDELRIVIDSAKPTGRDLLVMLGNLRYRLEPRLQAAGVALHWEVGNIAGLDQLTPQQVLELTRIVQEAFTNVLKHSHASQLRLRIHSGSGEALELSIEDNGCGFDPALAARGEGLGNMKSRAERIGARLAIDSAPGSTRVALRVP